jgi:diguanylate cyclase (GGDEF)-like protein
MISDELDRSKRALYQAQDRIAELTKAQLAMSGTLGQLTELASTDALTGLSNRRRFLEAFKAIFQVARTQDLPLSVVMIDVDSFKSYNDTFGHSAGDEAIWVVAKLLLRNSGGDQVVARYGGEEFAILLPSADASTALEIAERLRASIASYLWPSRRVTASIGISTLDRAILDPSTMLEQADRALYHSKSQGRNRVTHHRALVDALTEATTNDAPERETSSRELLDSEESPSSIHMVSSPRLNSREIAIRTRAAENSWDALERFVQALNGGNRSSDVFRDVLSAIREGTEAEIVFLCDDQSGEVLGADGDHVPSSQWYHQFARKLADELPGGGIWKPSESSWSDGFLSVPEPAAAIVLPVKAPGPGWLIALRFRDCQTFQPADLRVARVIWQLHIDHHRHDRVHDKLKETLFGVVRCLSTAIDAKDPYTCGHSERVARIAVRLGNEMGLTRGEISDLYLAGLLHDVGKIGIRDDVLRKEGELTLPEFLHIKEHPVTGERIIANVTKLSYLCPGVRGHHERYDGDGYPDGLIGEAIPKIARILAVADSCDAMMSFRRYRPALSDVRIEQTFRDGMGTQWDPRIVRHFLECRQDLYAVIQRGLGHSVYIAVERAIGGGETTNGAALSSSRLAPSSIRSR